MTAPPDMLDQPYLRASTDHHTAWLTQHNLVPVADLDRYHSYALPELIAHSYPEARGPHLLILVDILGWFTVVGDHFGGLTGPDLTETHQLIAQLRNVMTVRGSPQVPAEPPGIVTAWHDLWQRQRRAMSDTWWLHAIGEWAACLDTFATETAHRAYATLPSQAEAVLLRRHGSCLYPFMNMLEWLQRTELPARLRGEPDLGSLRANTADAATLINDLFSLERDEQQNSPFNMVTVLQRAQGLSRSAAIASVRTEVRRLRDDSDTLRDRLCAQYPDSSWYLHGTRQLVDGVHAWSSTTRRYRTEIAAE